MKKTTLTALFIFVFMNIWAQNNIGKSALLNAKQMSLYYNNKDFINYVNYVFPQDYANDINKKTELANIYKKYKTDVTDKIEIIKVLKTSTVNGQYQALFLEKNSNQEGYIFGVSNNKGQNWFFTSAFSKQVKFDLIINEIPTIDKSFSKLVDPKFGKRITYKIGESIATFSFTDINGNLLSSDLLKGKVIVINFWGTTCTPCIAEMPELNNLVEKMKGKEVVFIAPVIDTSKETLVNNFLPKYPFKYQIVIVDSDDYSITGYPTNLVIDQNLKVVEKLTGVSPENIKKLEQKINELIK
jgi:thiol-disulfide isomerase/thioredoxin